MDSICIFAEGENKGITAVQPSAATVHRTGTGFVKDIFYFENVGAAIGRPHCTTGFAGGE